MERGAITTARNEKKDKRHQNPEAAAKKADRSRTGEKIGERRKREK